MYLWNVYHYRCVKPTSEIILHTDFRLIWSALISNYYGCLFLSLPRTYPLRAFPYLRVITFCNVLYRWICNLTEYRTSAWLLLVWLSATNSLCWLCSDLQSVTGYSERCKLNNGVCYPFVSPMWNLRRQISLIRVQSRRIYCWAY